MKVSPFKAGVEASRPHALIPWSGAYCGGLALYECPGGEARRVLVAEALATAEEKLNAYLNAAVNIAR